MIGKVNRDRDFSDGDSERALIEPQDLGPGNCNVLKFMLEDVNSFLIAP
jgi:hypothetical protein